MKETLPENYQRRTPLLWIYVRGLLIKRKGLNPGEKMPALKLVWQGYHISRAHLKKYLDICGSRPGRNVPMLYPHMITFGMHMRIITHRAFPFKYLNMLQLRNHIIQNRPIGIDERLDISCEIADQRNVSKGLEYDMYTVFRAGSEVIWENINTYFFPGKFGPPEEASPNASFRPLPEKASALRWTTPSGGGFKFALICGDYNGIHYIAPYARIFGFNSDFAHGQFSIIQCAQHLPRLDEEEPVRIDVSLKGPMYYSSEALLKYVSDRSGLGFDLYCGDNPRPCIIGSMRNVTPGSRLIEVNKDKDSSKKNQELLRPFQPEYPGRCMERGGRH
jgi:hypothetical protein